MIKYCKTIPDFSSLYLKVSNYNSNFFTIFEKIYFDISRNIIKENYFIPYITVPSLKIMGNR